MAERALLKLQINLDMLPDESEAYGNALTPAQALAKGDTISRAGETSGHSTIVLEGFAARERCLADGTRQIVSIMVPGDICDLESFALPDSPYSITALTPLTVAYLPHAALRDLIGRFPRLGHAFWRETFIDASIFQEWIVNVGARRAVARVAHLLCELYVRLNAVGLADNQSFMLPIGQSNLAAATGLSVVHVNRTLQRLKTRRLVKSNAQLIAIQDWSGLKDAGQFDQDYLYSRVPADMQPLSLRRSGRRSHAKSA